MIRTRGFTLIELAIVLVIITVLIGGLAMPLSAQIEARRIAETRKDMEAIQDALIGYAMSNTVNVSPPTTCTCVYDENNELNTPDIPLNPSDDPDSTCPVSLCPISYIASATMTLTPPVARHYLPCPADKNNDDGIEDARDSNGQCPNRRGGLPWRTLGVKGQDAWGNRYTYAVTMEFANDTSGFVSTPTPSKGDQSIFADAGCALPTVAENVLAVVVSHGPNGRGAQNVSGGTPLAASRVPFDERQNLDIFRDSLPCKNETKFVSRTPTETFDDLLIWVSPNELFSRVCPAGGCR